MRQQHRVFRTVLLIFIVAVVVRWLTLTQSSLWFDEAFTRDMVVYSNPLDLALGRTGDLLPPLHFVLLSGWVRLAGDSVLALRGLSALAAVLALPAIYQATRMLFGQRAAFWALTLAALSPVQVMYAQEVRFYAVMVMWAAWLMWGVAATLRGRRYGIVIYALSAVGGLYTHYFFGILLALLHGAFMFDPAARAKWRRFLMADLIVAILFLPQVVSFLNAAGAVLGSFWIAKPNPAAPLMTLTFLLFGTTLSGLLLVVGVVLTILTLIISWVDLARARQPEMRKYWLMCISVVVGMLVGVMIISLVRNSIYLDRSFLLLSPLLVIALGGGIATPRRGSPLPLLGSLILVFMVIGIVIRAVMPDIAKPPFRAIAADLASRSNANSAPIFYLHDSVPLSIRYYQPALDKVGVMVDLGDKSWLYPQNAVFPDTWRMFGISRVSRQEMTRLLASTQGEFRVIITATLEPTEQAMMRDLLARQCRHTAKDYPPFVTVYEFACRT